MLHFTNLLIEAGHVVVKNPSLDQATDMFNIIQPLLQLPEKTATGRQRLRIATHPWLTYVDDIRQVTKAAAAAAAATAAAGGAASDS